MGGFTRANMILAAENTVHTPDANKTTTGWRGDPTTQNGGLALKDLDSFKMYYRIRGNTRTASKPPAKVLLRDISPPCAWAIS